MYTNATRFLLYASVYYNGAVYYDCYFQGHFSCFKQDPIYTLYHYAKYITKRKLEDISMIYDEAGIIGEETRIISDVDGDVDGEEDKGIKEERTSEGEDSNREYKEELELKGEDEGVPIYRQSVFARDQERENRVVQRDEVIVLKEDKL